MNAFAAESLASPAGRAAKAALPEERFGRAYLAGLAAAVAIHAAILFAWQPAAQLFEQAEFGVEVGDASVEVSLVAALPAEEPTAVVEPPPVPPPPEPVPPPPPPEPTPVVEPPPAPVVKAEMTIPTPEPAAPPRPTPREKPRPQPKAAPNPATTAPRTARPVGDGSSAIPGNDATTARAAAGGTSKPGYLRNPHPAYPESARAARQEGVVMLQVKVDARGNVSSVRVSRSSGYAVLDERARSTVAGSWKFRPARVNGVEVATEVTVPIRFRLNR